MRRRYLVTLLVFVVSPAIAYIAFEYLPILGLNSHSVEAFVATKSVTPTPIPATTTPNMQTNTPGSDTCDNLLVLVDKVHGLPQNYAPPDRVHLADYSIPITQTATSGRLIMVNDLQRLFADSTSAGIDLKVVSAYRSYDLQASVYASYAQQYGANEANAFSAQPGHSQHQLGTAIDFGTQELGYDLSQSFASTKAGQWLQANAYKYGFYLAYPEAQGSMTGYEFEPWHFRYIGVQNALNLKMSGLGMQAYLERYGVLPNCVS